MKILLEAMWDIFYDILNFLTLGLPEAYYRKKWLQECLAMEQVGAPTLWSEKVLDNFKHT